MSKPGRGSWIHQHSAGGVVVRGRSGTLEFLAIKPRGTTRWQLPKGAVEVGETPSQAALREVREEGGVSATIVGDLGPIRYFYRLGERGFVKTVDFYLMRYQAGDSSCHDHEVEEAVWFPMGESRILAFSSERELVRRAVEAIDPRLREQ